MIFPSTFQTKIEPVAETPTAVSTRESCPSFRRSKINVDHQFSKVIRILIRQEKKIDATHYLAMMLRQHAIGQVGVEEVSVTSFNNNKLRHFENSSGTECVTLLGNPAFSLDDRQALRTIISIWPTLSPESKIEVMQAIESARKEKPATL